MLVQVLIDGSLCTPDSLVRSADKAVRDTFQTITLTLFRCTTSTQSALEIFVRVKHGSDIMNEFFSQTLMEQHAWIYKGRIVGLYLALFVVLYLLPNQVLMNHARYLPLFAIDRKMPFLPWTFLIYVSDYALILLPVFLLKPKALFDAYARMAFGVLMVSGGFFWLFQTTYPRPEYPTVNNPVIAAAMSFIGTLDTPGNCFPSMHVASTCVAVWALRSFSTPFQVVIWVWLLAICVSTLTTKQHYAVDIMGGMLVAIIIAVLEWHICLRTQMR